ncbi:MAG: VOC family protein [Parvularculaceae bacterium]
MRKMLLTCIAFAMAACASGPTQQADNAPSVRALISQDSMNVYRRFVPEKRAEMIAFYKDVLGLEPLNPIDLGGGQEMLLFAIGGGQIKLASGLKEGRDYHLGPVNDGVGIRLFTLFFPDETALAERFTANGYPAPEFRDMGGARAALVEDPGGFSLELVILPDAPEAAYQRVEVGINASDLDRSRAFYRDFVGLDELPPVKDKLLGVTKHPYRHGETTINLWSVGENLPADTGSAGVQYVVSDVEAVNANAEARRITVETPLGGLPGFNLKFVWLNDPDGVTNYFAQVGTAPSESK